MRGVSAKAAGTEEADTHPEGDSGRRKRSAVGKLLKLDLSLVFGKKYLQTWFALLVKGADWFVDGSAGIADRFGIPQLVIGLTNVAMGTSAPEAAVSITAALKGNADIAIGNIVGSNTFNILFVLGASALIIPVPFEASFVVDCLVAVVAGVMLWLCSFRKKKLTRTGGVILLVCYAAYFSYLLVK